MKKFIALLALVLVSASTMMYAQESNAAIRRADRKAERDAERAKLRAEEQVQDMAAYQQAVQALKNKQFVLQSLYSLLVGCTGFEEQTVCSGSQSGDLP